MAPVLSLPITHYPFRLGLIILLLPWAPRARQISSGLQSCPVVSSNPEPSLYAIRLQSVHGNETPAHIPSRPLALQSGGKLQSLHSSLPGAVSARVLNPAIRCRMPSITACLRVSKKLSCRTTASSCGKWHARTTSDVVPSNCQNSRRLLDAARRMRALFLTPSRKLLEVSPLPRQQSEEPEPEAEAFSERLRLGVLLRLHRLRS